MVLTPTRTLRAQQGEHCPTGRHRWGRAGPTRWLRSRTAGRRGPRSSSTSTRMRSSVPQPWPANGPERRASSKMVRRSPRSPPGGWPATLTWSSRAAARTARSTTAVSVGSCQRPYGPRSSAGTEAVAFRDASAGTTSMPTTSSTGPRGAQRAKTTSCCSAAFTTALCTRTASPSTARGTARSSSADPTGDACRKGRPSETRRDRPAGTRSPRKRASARRRRRRRAAGSERVLLGLVAREGRPALLGERGQPLAGVRGGGHAGERLRLELELRLQRLVVGRQQEAADLAERPRRPGGELARELLGARGEALGLDDVVDEPGGQRGIR